ncbi:MAG: ferric reductase-like transmembrane domain-containing protein [Candidatus Woesearchaeota archaeon]|nr:MAG: ferric reductase-like transmembrane domain-containing protein [Candidatus Woesearchaeota archaeon]
MKKKPLLLLFGVLFISLLPLLPWYFLGPTSTLPFTYENVTHGLGQLCALVGMTLFALSFVLSTRLKIIDRLAGGLDKVYVVHRIVGSLAFVLLLFHPLLLVFKFLPDQVNLAARYLLPGHGLSVDLGIIALAGMLLLLGITFYVRINYHYWKFSHKFLSLFFIIASLHVLLVRGTASRDYIFAGYYVYAGLVAIIGTVAFLYALFLKGGRRLTYVVSSITRDGDSIYDIVMLPKEKSLFYQAGQFAFFSFHNAQLGSEFHPFSLASAPTEKSLRIIVKSLGDYTSKLHYLRKGDLVSVEGPYGGFTLNTRQGDQIWIGAGIGITPFIGLAKELLTQQNPQRNVTLYYCTRSMKEMVALKELQAIAQDKRSGLHLVLWCSDTKGRISSSHFSSLSKKSLVYLCGPEEMKRSLISQLLKRGVPAKNIFSEEFGFK